MVLERVQEIIAEQLEKDVEEIGMDSQLNEDLKADSVEVVGIIMSLESEFNMEFPYEELEKLKSVGDLVNYIEANQR